MIRSGADVAIHAHSSQFYYYIDSMQRFRDSIIADVSRVDGVQKRKIIYSTHYNRVSFFKNW